MRVELQNIKAGLHGTSRYIQEPKQLKEKIKELYRLHLGDFEEVCMYICTYIIFKLCNI